MILLHIFHYNLIHTKHLTNLLRITQFHQCHSLKKMKCQQVFPTLFDNSQEIDFLRKLATNQ